MNESIAEELLKNFFSRNASEHFRERRSSVYEEEENLNVKVKLSISFEEAFSGAKKTIAYSTSCRCAACDGNGYSRSSKFIKCPQCNGQGYTIKVEETFFGQYAPKKVICKSCRGTGNRHETPCGSCGGSGLRQSTKTVSVNIPAGAYDGMELRVARGGNSSKSGKVGDLYILICAPDASPDGRLKRATPGQNIRTSVTVSYYELLVGAEKCVTLPDGTEKRFRLPANTPLKSQLKLKGCGFRLIARGPNDPERGDLIISLDLETPKSLTERQMALLKKFDDSLRSEARDARAPK